MPFVNDRLSVCRHIHCPKLHASGYPCLAVLKENSPALDNRQSSKRCLAGRALRFDVRQCAPKRKGPAWEAGPWGFGLVSGGGNPRRGRAQPANVTGVVSLIADLMQDWRRLDERIETVSSEIEALARQDESCQRLMTVPGVGPIISSTVVAAVGNGAGFKQGRDFGAWLGRAGSHRRPFSFSRNVFAQVLQRRDSIRPSHGLSWPQTFEGPLLQRPARLPTGRKGPPLARPFLS